MAFFQFYPFIYYAKFRILRQTPIFTDVLVQVSACLVPYRVLFFIRHKVLTVATVAAGFC
jgi:hypothetical protein